MFSEVEKIGITKYGAEMVSHRFGRSQMFYFAKAFDESQPYAFEVKRSEFDAILANNAVAKGVHFHEGVKAQRVEFRSGRTSLVHAEDREGQARTWEARFIVDASGRDTFLSGQLGGKHRSTKHGSAAIFAHFEGVVRLTGMDEGNITAGWLNDGWCWLIPFKDGTMSVGVVCHPDYIKSRRSPLDQFLMDTLRQSPPIAKRMEKARPLTSTYAAANFSYRRETMCGDGYLMVGDAFAFIDPVFSSGVHLALNSGTIGAGVVDAYLRRSSDYPDSPEAIRTGRTTWDRHVLLVYSQIQSASISSAVCVDPQASKDRTSGPLVVGRRCLLTIEGALPAFPV